MLTAHSRRLYTVLPRARRLSKKIESYLALHLGYKLGGSCDMVSPLTEEDFL